MPQKTEKTSGGQKRGLVGVLKSFVPFLFKQKPKKQVALEASAVKVTKLVRVSQDERTVSKPLKKVHHKKKGPAKAAVPSLQARKMTKAPVEEAADESDEHDELEVSDAAPAQPAMGSVRERSVGRIVSPAGKAPVKDVIDLDEDQWLKKALHSSVVPNGKGPTAWSILRSRFFSKGGEYKNDAFLNKTERPQTPEAAGNEKLTAKDLADDQFLQKVVAKEEAKAGAPGNAASKEEVAELKEQVGKQEELAKKREAAFQQELERQKKELAQRKTSGAAISAADKKALKAEAADQPVGKIKPVEEPKPEAKQQEVVIKKSTLNKKPSGLTAFVASIGHIGLGKERTLFIQNLGTMLGAGLSLVESLRTLEREAHAKPMKKMIGQIIAAVENGYPLWRAMEQQCFFSPHALALVRIGEEAGNLAENVVYLAQQEEKDHALRGKVKMAMIYPSIVMVLMFIIVVGLGMFVLPQLIGVITSLNVPLPFATRMVILFTDLFTEYGAVFVPSSIAFFVVLALLSKFTNFKIVTQWVMFRIPGIGALAREATIARFGVILGGLLKAGVPVVEAMQSLVQVTPIVAYRKLYAKMLDHIIVGDSFAKSFQLIKRSEKLLPPSVQQLVITGERSGALADITLKVADIYDKKASDTAQKLPVILEPMLLLFIGALVGTIAFAIIVPIYSIVGNVGMQ